MDRLRISRERAAGGEQRQNAEAGRDRGCESKGRYHADPLAEPSHHRDLDRPGDAGHETHAHGECVPSRHRRDGKRLR